MRVASRASLLLVLSACASACASACGPSAEEGDAIGRYLIESLTFARQTADTALIEELFLPDATYDDFPGQIEYRGIEEIVGHVTSPHEWGDDVFVTLGNVETGPASAVGEWYLGAVQNRPIPELVPTATGLEVTLNGVTLIEIEGGRIARAADYADRTDLLLELGARIELPGGGVLGEENP